MTDTRDPMDDLDALLNEVARTPLPDVTATLEARLLHDAERLMPSPAPRPRRWAGLLQGLGGWPTVGGLMTATAAGVWIGFAAPAILDGLASDAVTVSVYPDMTLAEVGG